MSFDKYIKVDVSNLEPQVTWGTNPEMGIGISERFPEIKDVNYEKSVQLHGTYTRRITLRHSIKTCIYRILHKWKISRLRNCSKNCKREESCSNITAVVVPGSQLVKKAAEENGIAQIFKDAGFEWREAGCSTCLGMNPDLIPSGEHCASTSNRNFEGRTRKRSKNYLVSPAMAAAAAIYGKFVDVRELEK